MSTKRRPHKKKKNGGKIALLAIFAVMAALALIVGIMFGGMILDTVTGLLGWRTPVQTDHTLPPIPVTEPNTDETEPGETDPPETEPPVVNSRKSDFYNFLVVGKDSAGLNTDVIMVISYDVKNAAVSLMQIPRDTYIEIEGEGHKINSVYALMYHKAYREGSKTVQKDGLAAFAAILSENLCIPIDYYALIDLKGFRNIVDIFGGVKIDVPADMTYYDPYQDLTISIKKGYQVMNGRTAEGFVRFRSGYVTADIGRMDAQKIFMSAFLAQVKDEISIDKIPALMNEVFENVITSVSVADCVYFAQKLLSEVDLGSIKMCTVPGEAIREHDTSGTWYFALYRHEALSLINESFLSYEYPIEDGQFDVNHVFNQEDNEYFNGIYNKDTGKGGQVSSADDIQDGSIYIPMLPPATKAPATEPPVPETEPETTADTDPWLCY